MKMLVLVESLETTSGWGTYASRLIESLRKQNVEVTILTADASSQGPRLPTVFAKRPWWRLAEWRLRHWMRPFQFDLVHVMVEPYAKLFPAFSALPFVITLHGTYADPAAHGPGAWSVDGFIKALQSAKRFVAVSEFTRHVLPEEFRFKCDVVWNGVDTRIRDESYSDVQAPGHPLVLSVGSIKQRKGFDRLIEGFAVYAERYPNAQLVIVGSVPDEALKLKLVDLARLRGVGDRVRFFGKVSHGELLGWYRVCDVFALTPVTDGGFEGFGLVYLEANVFGKPAVGSRGSGAAEAIINGVNGLLVDPANPDDVARGLERALILPRQTILASLSGASWDDRAKAYLVVYWQALEDK